MRLVANECANCRRPVGYLVPEAFKLPTLCVLCVADPEVLEEWDHEIDSAETPILQVIMDYRRTAEYREVELKKRLAKSVS